MSWRMSASSSMPLCSLDLGQLHLAARINISEWRNNKQSMQYISFIKGKGGRKLSDYFRDFIGCQEGVDSPGETRTLLKAFSDFVESEGMAEQFLGHVLAFHEIAEGFQQGARLARRIHPFLAADEVAEIVGDLLPALALDERDVLLRLLVVAPFGNVDPRGQVQLAEVQGRRCPRSRRTE